LYQLSPPGRQGRVQISLQSAPFVLTFKAEYKEHGTLTTIVIPGKLQNQKPGEEVRSISVFSARRNIFLLLNPFSFDGFI
jgi:hypothetical protein